MSIDATPAGPAQAETVNENTDTGIYTPVSNDNTLTDIKTNIPKSIFKKALLKGFFFFAKLRITEYKIRKAKIISR